MNEVTQLHPGNHPVYEGGPNCDLLCPGEDTDAHERYRNGFIAGENNLAANVRGILPMVDVRSIKRPNWFNGPTRTAWFKVGVHEAITYLGGVKR